LPALRVAQTPPLFALKQGIGALVISAVEGRFQHCSGLPLATYHDGQREQKLAGRGRYRVFWFIVLTMHHYCAQKTISLIKQEFIFQTVILLSSYGKNKPKKP
jgi:hypothetical protein